MLFSGLFLGLATRSWVTLPHSLSPLFLGFFFGSAWMQVPAASVPCDPHPSWHPFVPGLEQGEKSLHLLPCSPWPSPQDLVAFVPLWVRVPPGSRRPRGGAGQEDDLRRTSFCFHFCFSPAAMGGSCLAEPSSCCCLGTKAATAVSPKQPCRAAGPSDLQRSFWCAGRRIEGFPCTLCFRTVGNGGVGSRVQSSCAELSLVSSWCTRPGDACVSSHDSNPDFVPLCRAEGMSVARRGEEHPWWQWCLWQDWRSVGHCRMPCSG